ncbi:hydroxysteroid dehydrogenase-like protein 2 isoform X3 [Pristis pectinata]|uniref:hydroxysteroid dehydrogenase-like protein 2 isoform X3 n=1 Tax=Pristis pectinata TaxID=685728 RepID=UPI00223DF53A|nr:hydroxysteroid dehydrogenase-like protein 2 isoform X3 [Pristis pectinata]
MNGLQRDAKIKKEVEQRPQSSQCVSLISLCDFPSPRPQINDLRLRRFAYCRYNTIPKMLQSTGKLAGRTLFITGASRGIGKAIALKVAKDGANIVIAAKTAEVHPKLPGTIYTAAEEIEAVGGKALPCLVDVRDEQQISEAVQNAVKTFGGIDILINNASAINLTGTLDTPMKKVDLMMSVNSRGTYLTSKLCIPYLKKSEIGHILNLSPPLNMNPIWFKNHCAYTMAKYGMSMCVLGMAEEFKGEIAVNALWPKTGHPLLPDFFLEEDPESLTKKMQDYGGTPAFEAGKQQVSAASEGPVADTFKTIEGALTADVVKSTGGVYQFELSGDHPGTWYIDLKNESGSTGKGSFPGKADVQMSMNSEDFVKVFSGKMKPTLAFMSGRLKIKGDMALAIKLENLMTQLKSKL